MDVIAVPELMPQKDETVIYEDGEIVKFRSGKIKSVERKLLESVAKLTIETDDSHEYAQFFTARRQVLGAGELEVGERVLVRLEEHTSSNLLMRLLRKKDTDITILVHERKGIERATTETVFRRF